MRSRVTRTLFAATFALFLAISASAAPEGRSESGNWLFRQINQVLHQLKSVFTPLGDSDPVPPKP